MAVEPNKREKQRAAWLYAAGAAASFCIGAASVAKNARGTGRALGLLLLLAVYSVAFIALYFPIRLLLVKVQDKALPIAGRIGCALLALVCMFGGSLYFYRVNRSPQLRAEELAPYLSGYEKLCAGAAEPLGALSETLLCREWEAGDGRTWYISSLTMESGGEITVALGDRETGEEASVYALEADGILSLEEKNLILLLADLLRDPSLPHRSIYVAGALVVFECPRGSVVLYRGAFPEESYRLAAGPVAGSPEHGWELAAAYPLAAL